MRRTWRAVRDPAVEVEADGGRCRCASRLRRGAARPGRRPRCRLRPPHRYRDARREQQQGGVHLGRRLKCFVICIRGRAPLRPMHVESRATVLSLERSAIVGAGRPADRAQGAGMSDLGVAEIPVDENERPLPRPQPPARNALVEGPILRTLLRLAWPNVIALSAGTCVVIAETSYIGRLGVESLAAMALVFPVVILTMTMSGGAMGGGVASAVARALGAGDVERASRLAAHALLISICFGLTFMIGMRVFGASLLQLLGGRGNVLANAIGYAQIFFGGAVLPWLMNSMAGILRGTGNMKLPSLMILNSAVCQ